MTKTVPPLAAHTIVGIANYAGYWEVVARVGNRLYHVKRVSDGREIAECDRMLMRVAKTSTGHPITLESLAR